MITVPTRLPSFQQGVARCPAEAEAPHWAFDRLAALFAPCLGVQGSTLFDVGPRKQHATITGAAWKPSPHGWVLDFSGGNYYAEADWIGQDGLPLTLMCLFKAPNVTAEHPLVWLGNSRVSSSWLGLRARGDVAGDPVNAFNHNYGFGSVANADTTAGFQSDTWHVATAVFVGASERHAYLDGAAKGADTATILGTITGHDKIALGAHRDTTPTYGSAQIALAAVWERVLSDVEIATLALDPLAMLRFDGRHAVGGSAIEPPYALDVAGPHQAGAIRGQSCRAGITAGTVS